MSLRTGRGSIVKSAKYRPPKLIFRTFAVEFIPKADWTYDLITDYRKSLKLVTFISTVLEKA